jgi:DNA-binding response OmpR family regulator
MLHPEIMFGTVLKKSGYEVLETFNGSEAWEKMQKPSSPILVVLDWMIAKKICRRLCDR